jgi:hypothetical protein
MGRNIFKNGGKIPKRAGKLQKWRENPKKSGKILKRAGKSQKGLENFKNGGKILKMAGKCDFLKSGRKEIFIHSKSFLTGDEKG